LKKLEVKYTSWLIKEKILLNDKLQQNIRTITGLVIKDAIQFQLSHRKYMRDIAGSYVRQLIYNFRQIVQKYIF
jgi:hypothetical protein